MQRLGSLAVLGFVVLAACARSVEDGETPTAGFATNNPAPLTACVETQCPAPLATCAGAGPCATDTSRDVYNCGACGNACPHADHSLNASAVCSGGQCALACDPFFADCNHVVGDGCETEVDHDPKNCGGCGVTCKDGDICWRGACGCPKGFTQCGDTCKNLQTDMDACGACDTKCQPPQPSDAAWTCGAGVQPPWTTWACIAGQCQISCKPKHGDCNGDLCADGCEIDESNDAAHCGSCSHACNAGQDCVDSTCLCPEGTTRCGDTCVDLNVDTGNCGQCGHVCPGASDDSSHGGPVCKGGSCGYTCYPGFADCNARVSDGCEVHIDNDQRHCGGCGTSCDVKAGQPCVHGQCLTKPCEGPEVTR